MRIAYPLYEGDGYLHFRDTPAKAPKDRAADDTGVDVRAIESRARR